MNGAIKLALPVILGISAGFVNYVSMSEMTRMHKFARIVQAVESGKVIDESMIEVFEMPGDYRSIARTFVSHDSFLNKGMIARRDLHPGDMLMWQDLMRPEDRVNLPPGHKLTFVDLSAIPVVPGFLKPGVLISFVMMHEDQTSERIGPFEIHSVGAIVAQSELDKKDESESRDNRHDRMIGLSLDVDEQGKYESGSEKLIQAIASRKIRMVDLDHSSGRLDRDGRLVPEDVKSLGIAANRRGG